MRDGSFFDNIDADINHFEQLYPSIGDNNFDQYYDSGKFNSVFSVNGTRDFSVIHVNIRSISANGDALSVYLSTLNREFDVICLSETWVRELEFIDDFFPNYTSFHSTRLGRRGGGVAMYIQKNLTCLRQPELSVNFEYIETIFLKISKLNKSILIGTCYRPPNSNYDSFQSFFEEKLSSISSGPVDVVICGDVNLDLLKMNDDRTSGLFYHTMNTLSLIPTINKPTRIADTSCTLIDNIFVSNLNDFTSGIFTVDITDHLPFFLVYKITFYLKL